MFLLFQLACFLCSNLFWPIVHFWIFWVLVTFIICSSCCCFLLLNDQISFNSDEATKCKPVVFEVAVVESFVFFRLGQVAPDRVPVVPLRVRPLVQLHFQAHPVGDFAIRILRQPPVSPAPCKDTSQTPPIPNPFLKRTKFRLNCVNPTRVNRVTCLSQLIRKLMFRRTLLRFLRRLTGHNEPVRVESMLQSAPCIPV